VKKLTQISLLFLALCVAMTGCDAAKDAAQKGMDSAADMADLGDFDLSGVKDKFAGITDGFKDVNAENVDGLSTKIEDLSGSIDGMGIGELEGSAKTAVGGMVSKFADAIKTSMEGISDEGVLGKLKPAVDGLLEKLNGFM